MLICNNDLVNFFGTRVGSPKVWGTLVRLNVFERFLTQTCFVSYTYIQGDPKTDTQIILG